MKRGILALEDGKGGSEYFDKVLDIDPEYAPAYAGKLCAEISFSIRYKENKYFAYQIKKEEDLARYYKPFDALPDELKGYYQKAVRFADETYRAKLEGYNSEIKKRIEELKKEFAFFMIITNARTFCEGYKRGYDWFDKTGRLICQVLGDCIVGQLGLGVKFKILRTGKYYEVREYQNDYGSYERGVLIKDKDEKDYGSISIGDIAVFTHEMLCLEKEEQKRLEEERKRIEVEENNKRLEEAQRKLKEQQEQQEKWASEGLCRYCGGKLSLFGKKCKSCGKEN
jgi:hypothetical protein